MLILIKIHFSKFVLTSLLCFYLSLLQNILILLNPEMIFLLKIKVIIWFDIFFHTVEGKKGYENLKH